ncbi:unnamed protein product [Prorocentrum cordatum]|uniref:Uncharacterized protein n=1 Tax=Prorocentrum cordatum TaxID=2364126 RepID=A0ABN9S8K4_9DINO|nr:unnamed protein product [Polarella glacialis]
MARIMAYLIAYQGMADDVGDVNAAEEVYKDIDAIEYTDMMQELTKRCNVSTIRAVKRAYVSLGRPSNAALAVAAQHAGVRADWAQCAGLSHCKVCLGRQRPRAARVAVLPRAKRFNEVVCTDVYHVAWKKKEREILASMGEFTRYEVDCPTSKDTFLKESKLWEKLWISRAGEPETIRMGAGGSRAAGHTHGRISKHGIKPDLIPKGARHRLGPMGRNHAVRRGHLSKCHLQFPDDSLETALRMTASQRNAHRNARGFSPAALVLGTQPKIPGSLCNDDFGLPDQAASVDPESKVHEMMIRRTAAATAFIEANCSRAARAVLLARSRPTWGNYEIGEWVYLWRPDQTQGLEKRHWHGPALAIAVETKVNEDNAMRTSVARVTHGRAIYRCTVEQLRPELPGGARKREGRSVDPGSPLCAIEKLRRAPKRTKGASNCRDLAEEGRLPQHDDHMGDIGEQQQPRAQSPVETDETDDPTGGAAAAAPGDPRPTTAGEDEGGEAAAASAGASGSAAQEPSRPHIAAMAKRSVEEAEKVGGAPLAKRAHLSWAKLAPVSEEAALADEVDDEMLLLEEFTEQVYMLALKRKNPAIVEGGLNRTAGWEPISEADVDPRACCPMRFLLEWKMEDGQKVAHARVLYQGIKHRDVAGGQLDRSAPTLSRFGRHTFMLWASLKKWRLFSADVKSALLQAEDASARGLKLHASPTKEMREMLSHQIGLQPGQLLEMLEVADDPFDARNFESQTHVVDGLIGKRVGDFIGRGEGATNEQDLYAKLDDTGCFQARLGMLSEKLKFGMWEFGRATAQDLLDANKDLRFLMANARVGLHFGLNEARSQLRRGSCTDANWASRHDGGSQGGHAIIFGPADELDAGTPAPFVAMEWASTKLQRLCGSSLSAEAQAAAWGTDSLMRVKVYLARSLRPDLELEEAMVHLGTSPFITDAKCLHDASRSATAGPGIAEKRAAIEVAIVDEQMAEIGATWKWVNHAEADGARTCHVLGPPDDGRRAATWSAGATM